MATSTEPPADRVRIVSTPDVRGGKPHIAGHRITVADIAVWHERRGMSPDEIVDSYPSITLSDVYAALAYYFENHARIDADILEGEQRAEVLRARGTFYGPRGRFHVSATRDRRSRNFSLS